MYDVKSTIPIVIHGLYYDCELNNMAPSFRVLYGLLCILVLYDQGLCAQTFHHRYNTGYPKLR
jgi:hypothetical protein